MNDDIRRRLEDAGRQPVPGPDPAFADALEARLLAVAGTTQQAEPSSRPGRPGRRLVLGGSLLAGAVGIALLFAVASGPARPVVAPELSVPVNVEVALADGTVLEDPDGLRLPEGSVVRVGPGGSARIGDTVLAPGDVATVEHGRLHVEHDPPVGVVPGGTPTRSPHATPTPTSRTSPSPRPTPTATAPLVPSGSPAPTATPAVTPTRPPLPSSPAQTPLPTRTQVPPPPTASPTPSPTPTIIRPRLRARVLYAPTRIRVTWTATPDAASYALVVSRSRLGPAPRPRYPDGRILGVFSYPPATAFRFRVPDGVVEVRLMVVALRADGTVLARSRIVTLAITPPAPAVSATPVSPTSPAPSASPVPPSASPVPSGG